MSSYQRLKGMADILPGEVERWRTAEAKARHFFEAHGFGEIRTPMLEPVELFARSVGEGSDIVHKQMYAFEDRGGRKIALRPEMTASVVRAAIENGLLRKERALRFFYLGPMFRAERPQKGRQRQFHQLGAEILNAKSVESDVEMLSLIHGLFRFLGIPGSEIRVNHLGCSKDRKAFQEKLEVYLSAVKDSLCEDCQYRIGKNVLRVLDCKNPGCQPLIEKAPGIELCGPCGEEYGKIKDEVKIREIPLRPEPRLVRGLDYYTGLVFEITAGGELGAQDAIAAGGRYDELIRSLGGPPMGAIGFAAGIERLLLAGKWDDESLSRDTVYVAVLDKNRETEELFERTSARLHEIGKYARRDMSIKNLPDHIRTAARQNIRFMIILGGEEVKNRAVSIKDLRSKEQKQFSWNEWPNHLIGKFSEEA